MPGIWALEKNKMYYYTEQGTEKKKEGIERERSRGGQREKGRGGR